jgi:hypothetical protein
MSGILLGETCRCLPECLVKLLRVGEEGHDQGVRHGEPSQSLLLIAAQRLREHTIQLAKKYDDGLVVHHGAAYPGTSPLLDRAPSQVQLLQPSGGHPPVMAGDHARDSTLARRGKTPTLSARRLRAPRSVFAR